MAKKTQTCWISRDKKEQPDMIFLWKSKPSRDIDGDFRPAKFGASLRLPLCFWPINLRKGQCLKVKFDGINVRKANE